MGRKNWYYYLSVERSFDPEILVSYFRIDSNDFVALFARIREGRLVAGDAVRMLVPKNVTLSSQRLVALPAAKMRRMPIFVHRFREFAAEN